MTLSQLTYFYEAAMLQHFNKAAERLNISQPSLSRAITNLEDELGVTLFEKNGRNVTLTKAGKIFLEHAKQILDDVERAENKLHQLSTDGGHIDIAYVSPLAREYIPRNVRSFLSEEKNRNVTFNFFQDITKANIAGLKEGHYDIIFGSYSVHEPSIAFVPILIQNMVVITPKNHPLTKQGYVNPNDFTQYPVLGYTSSSGLGRLTRDYWKSLGVTPSIICEAPDEIGIASFVAEDFGIALIADVEAIHRDDIDIIPLIPEHPLSHTVYMGYRRDKYQLPAVSRFIKYVTDNRPFSEPTIQTPN